MIRTSLSAAQVLYMITDHSATQSRVYRDKPVLLHHSLLSKLYLLEGSVKIQGTEGVQYNNDGKYGIVLMN